MIRGARAAVAGALALGACHGARPPAPPAPVAAVTPPPTAPAPPPDAFAASGRDWTVRPVAGAEPAFAPPAPEHFALASGVQVVLVENHRLPLVSFRVVNGRAGSREDAAAPGLAALVADLIAEGAGRRDAAALAEELERLGATLDSGVSADSTTVSLDTLRDTLAPSVALLADVVTAPRFAAADVARLRDDRLAELALRPDEPRQIAALVFEKLIYGAHPYGAPGLGYVATVKPLGAAQIRRFWREHYGPAATTIIVAGDVTRAAVEPLLARGFGRWRGAAAPATTPAPTPIASPPTLAFVDRPGAPQSVVWMGRLGPATADPAYFAEEVINTAIGGSFASRLNARLRETLGYTYGVGSTFWRGRWGGSWAVTTSLKTENTLDGIREALAIVDDARAHPLPAAELAKAQQLITRSLPQGFETNAGLAASFEQLIADGRPLDWYPGVTAAIDAVTAEQARAAAEAWSGLTIVVVGDWAAVGAGLAGFGLPIVHLDAEGNPAP